MNCTRIRLIIDQLIDTGHADNAAQVHVHMAACKDCADYYAFWRAQKDWAPAKAPDGFADAVMARVMQEPIRQARIFTIHPFIKYVLPSAAIAILLMIGVFQIYTIKATVPVTFRIAYENASSVAVVGDFNDWNSGSIHLAKKDGVWEATVSLRPNRYQYMFVIDGTKFVPDPDAQMYADDGFGQKNSIIDITKA